MNVGIWVPLKVFHPEHGGDRRHDQGQHQVHLAVSGSGFPETIMSHGGGIAQRLAHIFRYFPDRALTSVLPNRWRC